MTGVDEPLHTTKAHCSMREWTLPKILLKSIAACVIEYYRMKRIAACAIAHRQLHRRDRGGSIAPSWHDSSEPTSSWRHSLQLGRSSEDVHATTWSSNKWNTLYIYVSKFFYTWSKAQISFLLMLQFQLRSELQVVLCSASLLYELTSVYLVLPIVFH